MNEYRVTLRFPGKRCLWILIGLFFTPVLANTGVNSPIMEREGPIDPQATPETKALLAGLKRLAPDHVLFGHQDDLAYGVNWKREEGRSDVKDVTGSYPAVYGWELGDLENGVEHNLDGVGFEDMKRWIREGYQRGGVITVAWHMDNPVSGGDAWDTTRAVFSVLPGGSNHELFKQRLDRFAAFVNDLKGPRGEAIPIIFRPWHEHTGSWFWWGARPTRPDEYVALWRFTVEYLRDQKKLHNLLYAYSPNLFDRKEEFLERYPGDEYVDIFGVDDYWALSGENGVQVLTRRLKTLVELAESHGKIAALTETGSEGLKVENWWTEHLLKAIKADPVSKRIAYVLVWRNANSADKPGHFYAPYPGQATAADFVSFKEDPFVLFENELPALYR